MKIKQLIKRLFGTKVYAKINYVDINKTLAGRTILITGGGTGIGKAIALSCIKSGAEVIVVGRREEVLKKVCEEFGDKCKYIVFDVQSFSRHNLFDCCSTIVNKPIDGFVNNAGIYKDKKPLDWSVDDFDDVINVNLKAPVFLTIQYLNYCKNNGIVGNVVITSSNRALFGDCGPYGISKTGLNCYLEGIARENILTGIRINAVCPGMTASDINKIKEDSDLFTSSSKNKRVILPGEIAQVVRFLLSNESACITGAVIPCDFGDRLR